jgi:hypothetical protein
VSERYPRRATGLRRALGLAQKSKSAPELVRKTFATSICETERDRLPAPIPTAFGVFLAFTDDILDGLRCVKLGRAPGPDGVYGAMIRVATPWLRSILPEFWKICGILKRMPTLWHTQATEPAYKKDPTDDPGSYRPIGIVPSLRSVIDYAFRRNMERLYPPHVGQHGFRPGVSAEHAILRVIHTTRTRNAPIALLDLKGAYPSVPRNE